MRIKDALTAMKNQKHWMPDQETGQSGEMITVWSEESSAEAVPMEYPRPQFQREQWTCLNGLWDYAFTKGSGRPQQYDGKILVPFSPESRRSGVNRRLEPEEYLWYARTVSVEKQDRKRLILHFDAVDQKCSVWWNGKCIGTHENGYLPFSFDVTDLTQEGDNTLWVRVQDDTDQGTGCRGKQTLKPGGMFYTAQSGIWQSVWMEWVPEKRIDTLKITPLFDEGKVRLEITMTVCQPVDIRVLQRPLEEEEAQGAEVAAAVVSEVEFEEIFSETDRKAARREARKTRPAEEATGSAGKESGVLKSSNGRKFAASVEIAIPNFREWSPEAPCLYDLILTSGEDQVRSYFAMRKFSVGKDEQGIPRLMLNNEPYFFNGILDQGYWPETLMTPPSDEAMIFDIKEMKRLGFNMLRKHIKIEPMRWYYHCDRIGMVVWQDMINGGGPIRMPLVCYLPTVIPASISRIRDSWYHFFAREDRISRNKWEADCMEMIQLLYNCPCIGLWVPFNEGWGQFDSLRITDLIRKEDPTRVIDHASGWFDQGGGDVKSVHNYFRPLKVEQSTRPFVLSEYGGYVCPIEGHLYCEKSYGYKAYKSAEEFTKDFRALQKKISDLVPEGLCGAVYTQVSDIEEEINGLYTYDRKVCKVVEEK